MFQTCFGRSLPVAATATFTCEPCGLLESVSTVSFFGRKKLAYTGVVSEELCCVIEKRNPISNWVMRAKSQVLHYAYWNWVAPPVYWDKAQVGWLSFLMTTASATCRKVQIFEYAENNRTSTYIVVAEEVPRSTSVRANELKGDNKWFLVECCS